MKPLLVVKPMEKLTQAEMAALSKQAETLRRRLEDSDRPIIVADHVAIYWLRPGDSTVVMDARAAAIRRRSLSRAAK